MKVRELIERLLEHDMGYEVMARPADSESVDEEIDRVERINEDQRPHVALCLCVEHGQTCLDGMLKVLEENGYKITKP